MSKELYETALSLMSSINNIKIAIERFESAIKEDCRGVRGRVILKTEKTINDRYIFANVRPTKYVQFLHSELKDQKKDLKAIEAEIKRSI